MTLMLPECADPAYWRGLAPGLHIDDAGLFTDGGELGFSADELQRCDSELLKEGYTKFRRDDWGLDMSVLEGGVRNLDAAGVPIVFAFVYDEFWVLFARLRQFLAHVLGEDYRLLPDFWVWHVAASDDDAGWPPHRDRGARALFADGRPKALVMWIPLTEAVPENGCLYLVPAHRDPTYNSAAEDTWKFDLVDVRAVPASPGTALCWSQGVVHWGARSSVRARSPRISAAFEFQRGDVSPYNEPLMDPAHPLNFRGRLLLIAKQLLQYDHKSPLSDELNAVVVGLLETVGRAP